MSVLSVAQMRLSRDVLMRFRQQYKKSQIGPADPRHTVCSDACQLWFDEKNRACVCVKSLNVHLCGENCMLPKKIVSENNSYVCPLTCMVVGQCEGVQQMQFTKIGKPIIHWNCSKLPAKQRGQRRIAKDKRRKLSSANPRLSLKIVYACLKSGYSTRCKRYEKNVVRLASAMKRSFKDTRAISYTSIRHFFNANANVCDEMPCVLSDAALENISKVLSSVIARYFAHHPKLWMGNTDAAIATMLYLLSEGWTSQGVQIVEKIDRLRLCLPRVQDIGAVEKISCRSMSTGTRAFKQYVLNKNGLPIFSKLLILNKHERAELYKGFYSQH